MFSHRYKYLFILFLILYSFLNISVLNGDRLNQVELPSNYLLLVISYLCLGVWFINLLIDRYIIPKVKGIHPIALQFILSVFGICILALLSFTFTAGFIGYPFSMEFKNLTLTSAFLFRVNLFLNTLNAVYHFNNRFKQKELEAEKLRMDTLNAKYELLNNQINPHFLFNSLNTLSSLIHQDAQKADRFLQKLSETYRYLLLNRENELVTLKEELNFIEEYCDLLMIRFEHSIHIAIDIKQELDDHRIPPTVLQLLIENVVKHNFFTEQKPVTIEIKSVGENLLIQNNIQKKKVNNYSSGIGLKNISERYKFFEQSISIKEEDNFFKVAIPLIKTKKDEYTDLGG